MNRVCSIDDCDSPNYQCGWCSLHFQRWKRNGDPLVLRGRFQEKRLCSIEGCTNTHEARGWCQKHYQSWLDHGDPSATKPRRPKGAGGFTNGYFERTKDGISKLEHVAVAERALGKPLPPDAVVHHVNENKADNTPTNLVVCPSQAYHLLLHTRMRAMEVCGNPNWRKCPICKQYDAPENLRFYSKNSPVHLACRRVDHANQSTKVQA